MSNTETTQPAQEKRRFGGWLPLIIGGLILFAVYQYHGQPFGNQH